MQYRVKKPRLSFVGLWCAAIASCFSVSSFYACSTFANAAVRSRPNVLLVMTDDQGYGDVGIHGNPRIRTPHIDRFASQGTQLTRFYCSPVCAPTRASLMTGRYYYRTGVVHTSRGGAKMHGDEQTIAEILADAGYATGIFGKWHLGDTYPMRPQDQGFAESLVHRSGGIDQTPDKPNSYFDSLLWKNGARYTARGYCTDVCTDAAIEFIRANRSRPFFAYLATNAPHTPLQISDDYFKPYLKAGLNETTARVYGMVENIDDNFGRLLRELDRLQIRDNTLVIFLTDNGPQQPRYNGGLRGRKSWTYEGGIHVPCFVQWPKELAGGGALGQLAAHIDLLPTILDACQVELPQGLSIDGISLLEQLRGQGAAADRRLFFQCHRGLQPQRYHNAAVVTQRYKLVMSPGTFGRETLAHQAAVFELYDLSTDGGEEHRIDDAKPEIAAQLRDAYDQWFDSVRSARNFTPGWIHIGNAASPQTHLCRYQDGAFRDGVAIGWPVVVETAGEHQCKIDRGTSSAPGAIFVSWLGQTQRIPTKDGAATIRLAAGTGILDIWFAADGQERVRPENNVTVGDVILR